MTLRRPFFGMVLSIAAVVLSPASGAWAHADQLSSDPAPDVVLEVAPTTISVRFSEAIEPVDDSLRLLDSSGNRIALGRVEASSGATTLSAPIEVPLSRGSYVVAWRALSTDSHVVRGAFSFAVGEASSGVEGVMGDLLSEQRSAGATPRWLGTGRTLSYSGMSVAIGGWVLLPVLSMGGPERKRARRMLALGMTVSAVGTLTMMGAQAAQVGQSFLDVAAVASTTSGRWWVLRLLSTMALGVVMWTTMTRRAKATARWPAAVGSTALLAVTAAGGHAVTGQLPALAIVATVVHLSSVSLWMGGLATLALVVSRSGRGDVVRAFAPWALGAVGALVLSGAIAAVRQLDRPGALLDTSYGRWLVAKLVIVSVVLAIAASVRHELRAGAGAGAGAGAAAPAGPTRRLRVELAGLSLAMVVTGGLTGATPPRNLVLESRSVTAFQGDRFAQIDLEPAVTGPTTLHVTLISPRGSLDRADEIAVSAELGSADLGPIDIPVAIAGANHVTTNEANLPLAGRWRFTVTARFGEFDEVVFTGELDVDER